MSFEETVFRVDCTVKSLDMTAFHLVWMSSYCIFFILQKSEGVLRGKSKGASKPTTPVKSGGDEQDDDDVDDKEQETKRRIRLCKTGGWNIFIDNFRCRYSFDPWLHRALNLKKIHKLSFHLSVDLGLYLYT